MKQRAFWFASVFEPQEILKAYAEAPSIFASPELSKFVRDQGDKAQFSVTLAQMAAGDVVLPPSIARVAQSLEVLARSQLHIVVSQAAPSAVAVEENLDRKSVFRIWRYNAGASCRPHYDPGLLTAMLLGSRKGLELNFTKVLPPVGHVLGNYDGAGADDGDDDAGWLDAASLRAAPSEDVLMIGNTTLQVLTGGALPHVLHRVVPQDLGDGSAADAADASCRYNMVLELRPHRSKDWYGMAGGSTAA